MRHLISGILSALAIVGLAGLSGAAYSQSLTDALISAYRNSEQLKSGQAYLRSVDEGVAQARSSLRPQVSSQFSTGAAYQQKLGLFSTSNWSYSTSLTLSAELTLWDGGTTALGIESARLNVLAERVTLVDLEQQVLLGAVTAFMDMRRDAQFLQLAENNRAVIGRQVQAAKDRFEVGEVRRTDVSQAEARYAGALSTVALRQGTLEISRIGYFVATGTYPGTLNSPPPLPNLPASLEGAKAIALKTNPAIRRAQQVVRIAEINVLRAEAAMKPVIKLSGSAALRPDASTGNTVNIGISGTAPIYLGGKLTSAHRQALALEERARAEVQHSAKLVSQIVTNYWAQIQIARASIVARNKEVRASRVSLRGIREEANLGARTTLDVLDAEREMVTAETNLVAALRDEYVAVYSLLSAMGLLTVGHLQLGIATYDTGRNYDKVSTAPGPTNRGKLLEKIFTRAGKK